MITYELHMYTRNFSLFRPTDHPPHMFSKREDSLNPSFFPGGDIGGGEGLIDPMYTLTAVAFQLAPVALREAEGGGSLTQEFVIVPHGTSPIGSGSTGGLATT